MCDSLKDFLLSMEQIHIYLFSIKIFWAGYLKFKKIFHPEKTILRNLVTEFFSFLKPVIFRALFCVLLLDGSPQSVSENPFIRYFIFAVYDVGNLAGWHTDLPSGAPFSKD